MAIIATVIMAADLLTTGDWWWWLSMARRPKGGEVIVCCTQHGAMTWDERMQWWICSGWAGEGCLTGMIVTHREVMKAAYGDAVPPGVSVTLRQDG